MVGDRGLEPTQVLRNVAIARRRERSAANTQLIMAAHWADCHPPETIDPAQLAIPGGDRPIRPGGEGTPGLAGCSVAELAAELGTSIGSGQRFIADALDLRHRLPRLWARLCRDEIDGWQARRVASDTRHLTAVQAGQVDDRVADQIGYRSWSQARRVVAAAIIAVDADRIAAEASRQRGQAGVWTGDTGEHGMKTLFARAEAPQVIWFEAMIGRIADLLHTRGDHRSTDQRRAAAIGILANPLHACRLLAEAAQPALFDPEPVNQHHNTARELAGSGTGVGDSGTQEMSPQGTPGPTTPTGDGPTGQGDAGSDTDHTDDADTSPVRYPRIDHDPRIALATITALQQIDPARLRPDATLYVHIAAETLQPSADTHADTPGSGVTRVEDIGPIVTDLVADWLPGCQTTIQPVIDLTADQTPHDSYEIPHRLRERVFLRQPVSVFPYTAASGRHLDLDHTRPYQPGGIGQTRADNLGPLSRREHRAVTHGGWQRRQPEPGSYLFRAPHGTIYLTNNTGTHHLGNSAYAHRVWQAAHPDITTAA